MKKDSLKKEIDSLRDTRNHNWNALILTIGGTLAVSFNLDSIYKWVLLFIGIVLNIIFIYAYFDKETKIDKLTQELEKEK